MEKAIDDDNIAEVTRLLDEGSDVNKALLYTVTHYNFQDDIIKLLISRGADPNGTTEETQTRNRTYLQYAVKEKNLSLALILLDNGANPNFKTPLLSAILFQDHEMVELLLDKGADPNTKNRSNETALMMACDTVNLEIVRILLEKGADPNTQTPDDDETALLYATSVSFNDQEDREARILNIVKLLLEKGADPNKKSSSHTTALMLAVSKNRIGVVKELIEKDADVNAKNRRGDHVIGLADNFEILKVLLEKGANPNVENAYGRTPLIGFVRVNDTETVKLLLQFGADPNRINKDGRKAIDYASSEEMRNLLSSKSSEPPVPYSGKSKSDIEFFNIFLGKVDESTTEGDMKNIIRNTTFCPVCLANTIRVDGCLYMHHKCSESGRNEGLYNKYKSAEGDIWWCVDCGRICNGHRHYDLGLANADKPTLLAAGDPFARACDGSDGSRTNGGGSTAEKLKRIARMIDYAFELQHFVGEISEREARNELIEETWNGALLRMRFDPLKFKRWKTDLSVFKEIAKEEVAIPEAVPQSGDIDTPTVDNGTDFISLDEVPVIQFKHKNKDGVMFNHIHGDNDMRFIGKDSLVTFMKTMGEKLGKCFDDDCGGWLWPQEIEMAFGDPKLKDSVTDEDRKVLASYKERFNAAKAPKTGGGSQWKFNFTSELTNEQCYLPKKKAGNRTRKHKKHAKKTRSL